MKSKIKNYLSGRSSDDEQKMLLNWLRKEGNLAEFNSVKNEWKNEIIQDDIPLEFRPNWSNIQNNLFGQIQSENAKAHRTLKIFRYAAALILLISVPSLLFYFLNPKTPGQVAFTTVSAEYGQISKVVLSDSTVIWVNSGSNVTYNNQFSASNRDIKLAGEAYFKVTKNKDLPLVVSSGDLLVKVLGTEFGVSAYPEEKEIQVVLENGKVELSSLSHENFRQVMKPGELASFNREKKEMEIRTVNTGLYTSWKDGMINVYNLPLSELVIKLEKRYNQKFKVDDEIKSLPFTFTIKNENLNSVLSLMEKITPVQVVQNKNVIELKYSQRNKQ
jgi:ferric-dicitrate binding protein FerR (iron transport regulator)